MVLAVVILNWWKWSTLQTCFTPALPELARRCLVAGSSTGASPSPKRIRRIGHNSIFRNDDGLYDEAQVVEADEPWNVLLDHIEVYGTALIQAPPKSGKTMLGRLASVGRVTAVVKRGFEVRYCANLGYYRQASFAEVKAMAEDSAASGREANRNTVLHFFDEAYEIPEAIYTYFIKQQEGYAIFATGGIATKTGDYVTPAELVNKTLFYHSPANPAKTRTCLADRLQLLCATGTKVAEVEIAADLMLNIAGKHIGILQFLGCLLQDAHATSLPAMRETLETLLTSEWVKLFNARCFGIQNGPPDSEQSELISMLRCSGKLAYLDEAGVERGAYDIAKRSHRLGLSQAYYAPVSDGAATISKADALLHMGLKLDMGFVHVLQAELYDRRFETPPWSTMALANRWVVNFTHHGNKEPSKVPVHVVDLVASWLSHVETADLLNAARRLDPREWRFQNSLDKFTRCYLRMHAVWEQTTTEFGDMKGFLDHFIDAKMGVELLIRNSQENTYAAWSLLGNRTWKSLRNHSNRTSVKYRNTANVCTNGYITVLVASLAADSDESTWNEFQSEIANLKQERDSMLDYPMMVAVAPPGWASFEVFLHQPGQDPVRFSVPRQRLMFKFVNNHLQLARHFHPQPKQVWVQRLAVEAMVLANARAFLVSPAQDSIADLARTIRLECGLASPEPLIIYRLNFADRWEEQPVSQVLYANTDDRPYGFVVPAGATFGQPVAAPTAAAGSTSGAAASSAGAAPAQIVRIRVVYQGNEVGVTFRRSSSTEAIKEAIRDTLELPADVRVRLLDSTGYGVTIDGSLPEGTYTIPG